MNNEESQSFKTELTTFADNNQFKWLAYANNDKWKDGPYQSYIYNFEPMNARNLNAIVFESRSFYPDKKKSGGCLIVNIVLTDKDNQRLVSLLNQLNKIIREKIHDHRTVYIDSECGDHPFVLLDAPIKFDRDPLQDIAIP